MMVTVVNSKVKYNTVNAGACRNLDPWWILMDSVSTIVLIKNPKSTTNIHKSDIHVFIHFNTRTMTTH